MTQALRTMRGVAVALTVATVLLVAAASPALGAGSWRLEQPPPPPGAPFKVPLGPPGDLQFYAPNAGILAVEGNATVARGLYFWNGVSWHQLSTVCGGPGDSTRVAWASAREFWTVTEPSQPRLGAGLGLCHFKDGQVIGSYSTAPQSSDPFRAMDSAACNGPSDCWFGGVGSQDPSGQRVGAFHLHWDGQSLTTVYAPQGRGVSDIVPFGGSFYETVLAGVQREDRDDPVSLTTPETQPRLIHRISGTTFTNSPMIPYDRPGVPDEGTELLAADQDGSDLWFVGGGAASGPAAPAGNGGAAGNGGPPGGPIPRPPIAIHYVPPFFQELAIPDGTFPDTSRFGDVAAVPGSPDAWVTVVPYADRASKTAKATVARLTPSGAVGEIDSLPSSGAGRGVAAKIAFTGPNDGWIVTQAGWIFHYTDGTAQTPNTDPAFAGTITARPNESAAQFIPDAPPQDDSDLFKPPEIPDAVVTPPEVKTLKALVAKVTTKLVVEKKGKRLRLRVRFVLSRPAQVQLIARHKKKVVAKSTVKKYKKKGTYTLVIPVTRKRYPDGLQLKTHEQGQDDAGDDSQTTTTRVAQTSARARR